VKSIRVSRADVQIRLETFNTFHSVNLTNPDSNLASGTFGKSTGVLPGRIFQLSGRLSF